VGNGDAPQRIIQLPTRAARNETLEAAEFQLLALTLAFIWVEV
jgi:hypothetical protein